MNLIELASPLIEQLRAEQLKVQIAIQKKEIMKNIHLLPTDKPSRLRYNLSNVPVFTKELYRDYGKEANQNIYITNSEEIKKGDWVLDYFGVHKAINDDGLICRKGVNNCSVFFATDAKKIILTTDQDLIKDGVQAIDDEFLEWFVKNPSCEEVEIERSCLDETAFMYNIITYEVIIPQEELIDCEYCGGDGIYVDGDNNTSKCTMCEKGKIPKEEPKQETLEEYIKEVTKNFGDEMSVKFTSGGIKLGAKWQADRMYSEEDMIESLDFSKSTNQEKSIYVARCLLNGKHIESKEILRIWKEQKPKLTTRMR